MADHLSTELLAGFRRRRLEPEQLLDVDDHVSGCAECRELLRATRPRLEALLSLRASLEMASPAEEISADEHLKIYLDLAGDPVDRELAESHFESCGLCRAQAELFLDFARRRE